MGGFFGVAAKDDCMFDLFFGTDYHSHLGTRRGGMAVYGEKGFDRAIHNIENAPFRVPHFSPLLASALLLETVLLPDPNRAVATSDIFPTASSAK